MRRAAEGDPDGPNAMALQTVCIGLMDSMMTLFNEYSERSCQLEQTDSWS